MHVLKRISSWNFKNCFCLNQNKQSYFVQRHWKWKTMNEFTLPNEFRYFCIKLTKEKCQNLDLIWMWKQALTLGEWMQHILYVECPHWYTLQLFLHEFLIVRTSEAWIWFRLSFFVYVLKLLAKKLSQCMSFYHLQAHWAKHSNFYWHPNLNCKFHTLF